MFTVIKKSMPYILVIGILCLFMSLIFRLDNVLIVEHYVNGSLVYQYDLRGYMLNLQVAIRGFDEHLNTIFRPPLDWSNVIRAIKSVGNILISVVNTLTLPFTFVGVVLEVVMALVGLPLNTDNFVYIMFHNITTLSIPYLDF